MKLLDLALRLRWSTIAERAVSHPHEISEQDGDGLTVLHWACCNNPPLRTIKVLLEQDALHASHLEDRAALKKDFNAMTPLLNACACQASVPVVSSLIEAVPESVSVPDNEGWTALHYVCYHATSVGPQYAYRVAERLLVSDTTLVGMKDCFGRTPLVLLCDMHEHELNKCVRVEQAVRPRCFRFRPLVVDDFWAIASLLARSSAQLAEQSTDLHYIVSIPDCPPVLLRVATTYYAAFLRDQDSRGNTPLHLAAREIDQSHFFLCLLLDADPTVAQIRNHDGALPLALALNADCSWTSSHNSLLEAHPVALETCGLAEVYYPFLLKRVTSPSTIFELLRARPTLVQQS